MNAYYARCMAIYGTPQEQRDWYQIEQVLKMPIIKFPRQDYINQKKNAGENVMETVFKPLVFSADILFFRGLPDGRIPAGVGQEIKWAREKGIPVLELPSSTNKRTISIEETREYLREVMR